MANIAFLICLSSHLSSACEWWVSCMKEDLYFWHLFSYAYIYIFHTVIKCVFENCMFFMLSFLMNTISCIGSERVSVKLCSYYITRRNPIFMYSLSCNWVLRIIYNTKDKINPIKSLRNGLIYVLPAFIDFLKKMVKIFLYEIDITDIENSSLHRVRRSE